jgi:hypothetical protein
MNLVHHSDNSASSPEHQLVKQHQALAQAHRAAAQKASARGDFSSAKAYHAEAIKAEARAGHVKAELKKAAKPSSPILTSVTHHADTFEARPSALKSALTDSKHGAEPLVVDSAGPAVEQSYIFPYQSICSPTLLQYGLLSQPPNIQIVSPVGGSNSQNTGVQIGGYAVGALPSNETPLAIRFKSGGQQGNSPVMLLLPGQVITPHGLVEMGQKVGEKSERSGSFSGFDLGLPFGWLGGGVGTVVILKNPNARVDWHAPGEVMYHQSTYAIVAVPGAGAGPIGTPPFNYPERFPWPQAQVLAPVTAIAINQGGTPKLQIGTPTRAQLRLRVSGLATAPRVYMSWQSMNPMDVGTDGLTPAANNSYWVDTWPVDPLNASLGANGAWPYHAMPTDYLRMFADAGGLNCYDIDGPLVGKFLDIQRWGRL